MCSIHTKNGNHWGLHGRDHWYFKLYLPVSRRFVKLTPTQCNLIKIICLLHLLEKKIENTILYNNIPFGVMSENLSFILTIKSYTRQLNI